MRRAFTLTELMIVIAIMAILAGLGFSAMASATNMAREHRTQSMIDKIDMLIMERYEGYRTRTAPVKIPARDVNNNFIPPRAIAIIRLNAIRDLMRVELPDRVSDVVDLPANLSAAFPTIQPPLYIAKVQGANNTVQPIPISLQESYRRRASRMAGPNWMTTWTTENQGSECLYLILSSMRDGDKSSLDYFDATEIGDTDGDGMLEILDGWGRPIEFLRWAPGYVSTAAIPLDTTQIADRVAAPDPFDPVHIDPRWQSGTSAAPYQLYPLIVSGGLDKQIDVLTDFASALRYSLLTPPDDPYYSSGGQIIGAPFDIAGDGPNWFDNITNQGPR